MENQTLETQTVRPAERRWIWVFATITMALTSLPYLFAFMHQGSNWHFTGFVFGVEDGNSYIAKMLSGAWGAWLFRTPYTAYPQDGVFLYFPFILLGKMTPLSGAHDWLVVLYHLYRLAAGFLVIFATYDFASVFLSEVRWRRFVTVLVVLGGGFGWISLFGFRSVFSWGLPLESYSPEAFGFLSLFGLPHLAMARALLLWGLRRFLLLTVWYKHTKSRLQTGMIWFGIGFFQPIIQAVGLFIVAFYLLVTFIVQIAGWQKGKAPEWDIWIKYLFSGIAIAVCAAPIAAYTIFAIKLNPLLQVWESQTIIGSPAPLDYLLGYGVVLPLALLGLRPLLKKFPWHGWLLAGWLLFFPIAAYAPFSSQRRLSDGFWVALSILAVYWVSKISVRRQKFALGWLVLAFPMTLLLLVAGLFFTANPGKPLFRPSDEVSVFEYLAANGQPWDVVLASDDTANPLPAWAPVRTLNGHGPESINGEALRARIACFYSSGCSDSDRQALLDEFGVDYVIWGPAERELGDWNPRQSPMLEEVFASGEYAVFR